MKQYEVIVVGAGIAGLYASYKLEKLGYEVLLLEASQRLGGTWESKQYKSSIYELGPNTILDRSEVLNNLIQELGLKPISKNHAKYIYLFGKLKKISNPIQLLFSDLLSLKSKIMILFEAFRNFDIYPEESVHDFFVRHFGLEFVHNLLNPMLKGIWAADIQQLSMPAALPRIYNSIKKSKGSIIRAFFKLSPKTKTISFEKGLSTLTEALGAKIKSILFEHELESIVYKDNRFSLQVKTKDSLLEFQTKQVILACPSHKLIKACQSLDPSLSRLLEQIHYAPIFLQVFTLPKKIFKTINAFGFVSAHSSHFTLGTIFASEIFDSRSLEDEVLFVSFMGGAKQAQILDFDKDDLWQICCNEHKEIFDNEYKIKIEDFVNIDSKFIPKALPQYNLGHLGLVNEIQKIALNYPCLKLLGNYLYGASIPDTLNHVDKVLDL